MVICGYKYILIMNKYIVMSTNIWLFTLIIFVHNFYKITKIYVLPFFPNTANLVHLPAN